MLLYLDKYDVRIILRALEVSRSELELSNPDPDLLTTLDELHDRIQREIEEEVTIWPDTDGE